MAHKFLRDDGWFQQVGLGDLSSTATSTGVLNYFQATTTTTFATTTTSFTSGVGVTVGTSGIWYVSAGASFAGNPATQVLFSCQITDGVNVIMSGSCEDPPIAQGITSIALSGISVNPSSNLGFFAKSSALGGFIATSNTSISNYITAIRIG